MKPGMIIVQFVILRSDLKKQTHFSSTRETRRGDLKTQRCLCLPENWTRVFALSELRPNGLSNGAMVRQSERRVAAALGNAWKNSKSTGMAFFPENISVFEGSLYFFLTSAHSHHPAPTEPVQILSLKIL
ncbi:hypothetical protein DNTS_004391 [Danionella cerebrum]|uniref:Uncharacterized protein n=1 Tax=Danionella cerebrum TaxID=2873325 RepID=A0A553RGB5_9TELE|nr:hypothetical protein DNTS_004391 [Danionella translucida]